MLDDLLSGLMGGLPPKVQIGCIVLALFAIAALLVWAYYG